MKKLTRKLFLSFAALAVCAATLVSTTFAWYVSNDKAEVSGVTGSIAGDEVGGNLLVALHDKDTNKAGNFSSNIKLVASTVKLEPMSKATTADTEKGVAVGDWINHKGEKIADATLITYDFWILSTDATTVKVEATLTNTTKDLVEQTVFATTSLPTAAGTYQPEKAEGEADLTAATAPENFGDTFVADAVNALAVEIVETPGDDDDVATKTITGALKGLMPTYATRKDMVTGGDANQYYNAVLGEIPAETGAAGASTKNATDVSWNEIKVTAGAPRRITINIWLEGADADCWDSCRGQIFNIDFKFTTQAETPNA